jgi:hypothetical protein
MTLSLLGQVVQDFVQPLGSQKQGSILHAYRNSFLLEVIPLLPREASTPRSESE